MEVGNPTASTLVLASGPASPPVDHHAVGAAAEAGRQLADVAQPLRVRAVGACVSMGDERAGRLVPSSMRVPCCFLQGSNGRPWQVLQRPTHLCPR